MTAFTTLRVTEEGVVLLPRHARRLAVAGAAVLRAFEEFAATASPGIYVLRSHGEGLDIGRREESRLFDGMPCRFLSSPFADRAGRHPKPASPSAYDAVRAPGVATLLTTADGNELLEACVAALVAWDGARLVVPPDDRPRVESTVENALRDAGLVAFAPLRRFDEMPLALVNAVIGVCRPSVAGRSPFPAEAESLVRSVLIASRP